jgi:HPt (histidine-containing phosphotransfer) domain-containing protein
MEQPNLNYINDLSGDNQDFKFKIINLIKIELPQEIEIYNFHISKNDFKSAASCVHKLKHKISILGLEKNYYIAENFEENLKQNSTLLQSDFELILKSMQQFVDSL